MIGRALLLALVLPLLGACNMVVSETPMFADPDRASIAPRDGIWLAEQEDCRFDATKSDAEWPDCAMWVVVRNAHSEFLLSDGKGQSQRAEFLMVDGTPLLVQVKFHDEEKKPGSTFFAFYGLLAPPAPAGTNKGFTVASIWQVKCGIQGQSASDIKPFPGISAECRPTSKDAIRAAALASRSIAEQPTSWRWLRPEATAIAN